MKDMYRNGLVLLMLIQLAACRMIESGIEIAATTEKIQVEIATNIADNAMTSDANATELAVRQAIQKTPAGGTLVAAQSTRESATLTPSTAAALQTIGEGAIIHIVDFDKAAEYVELKNSGNQTRELTGWKLVSDAGGETCFLAGSLAPQEMLTVWFRLQDETQGGFNCGLDLDNVFRNVQIDPAVLYNAHGVIVSRSDE